MMENLAKTILDVCVYETKDLKTIQAYALNCKQSNG